MWTLQGDTTDAQFASAVSDAGDVNGDGFADVLIGAYGHTNDFSGQGRAYLYLGDSTGLSTDPAWFADGPAPDAKFGYSVSSAGDVNGDGLDDALIGAYGYSGAYTNQGRASLYLGTSSGLAASPVWTAEGDKENAYFGFALSSAGDVNGDGFADVIVGAYGYGNDEPGEGRAYVYLGNATGLGTEPWLAEGNQANASFGYSVAGAGDVDGDGFADVIVGSVNYTNGEVGEGRAYLYKGGPRGLTAAPTWMAEVNQSAAKFGYGVAGAGDLMATALPTSASAPYSLPTEKPMKAAPLSISAAQADLVQALIGPRRAIKSALYTAVLSRLRGTLMVTLCPIYS